MRYDRKYLDTDAVQSQLMYEAAEEKAFDLIESGEYEESEIIEVTHMIFDQMVEQRIEMSV